MEDAGARGVRFCVDDIVALKTEPAKTAVVERTHHDVDSHAPNPQDDYDEDLQQHPQLSVDQFRAFLADGIPPRGTVLIAMHTDTTALVVPESELLLFDRHLLVGDIVRRTVDSPMSGTIISSQVFCTLVDAGLPFEGMSSTALGESVLRLLEGSTLINGVPADELNLPHDYTPGQIIIHRGDWVGRIDAVHEEITVGLRNGSAVAVRRTEDLEYLGFEPDDRLCVTDIVRTKKANLRQGDWKFGAYNPNLEPVGKVVNTRATSMEVSWLFHRPDAHDAPYFPPMPPDDLGSDELESGEVVVYDMRRLPAQINYRVTPVRCADFRIGQRVRFRDIDAAAQKYNGSGMGNNGHPNGRVQKKPRTETQGFDMNVFIVVRTIKKFVVQWQDLSTTEEYSTDLVPDPNADDENELWPGDIVCTHAKKNAPPDGSGEGTMADVDDDYLEPVGVGVVQTVKPLDRIAQVRWCPNANVKVHRESLLPGSVTGRARGPPENISIYDVHAVDALNLRRGDLVVIRFDAIGPDAEFSVPDKENQTSWLGEVIDCCLDGLVTVRLGLLPKVQDVRVPVESLLVIYDMREGDPDDMASSYLGSTSASGDSSSYSVYSIGDGPGLGYLAPQYEYNYDGGERMDQDSEDAWSTEDEEDIPIGDNVDTPMTDVKDSDSNSTQPPRKPGPSAPRSDPAFNNTNQPKSPPPPNTADQTSSSTTSQAPAQQPATTTTPSERPPRFAVLDTPPPSDHHYITHPLGPHSNPRRLQRTQKEHTILRNSLPDDIFVRTWESRLDLLRVLIVGPVDTPYEFAPFVVDLRVPLNYPAAPPDAFFHSWTDGKGPINPNLYEDGKICLSLLGTWHTSDRNETWAPGKSTLLQVLVSLMGLVLVREPYYNEAGYEVRAGTAEAVLPSALYSERVYFRSRAFITRALGTGVPGLDDVLRWLYLAQPSSSTGTLTTAAEVSSTEEASARPPRLLDRAIETAQAIVQRSETETEESAGAETVSEGRKVSKGAVILLKRQIQTMEALRKK